MAGPLFRRAGRIAASMAAVMLAAPVAAAPCWAPAAIGAARVQQFEIMLMSVSLRCRLVGVDLAGPFERFREAHKARLESVLGVLEEHYGARSSREGKRDLDHFVIQLANGFGGGRSDAASCQGFGAVLAELNATEHPAEALETFAFAMVRDPFIDGPRCPPEAGEKGLADQMPRRSAGSTARR